MAEHSYTVPALPRADEVAIPRKRKLLSWLDTKSDVIYPSPETVKVASDGVLNHSCAVLNDGLLILEFRDAIREGDGPCIARCWKLHDIVIL